MTWNARFKCQIRVADSQDMIDVLMVVVELDGRVGIELALHSDVYSVRVGRCKGRVHADGDPVGGKGAAANSEVPERVIGEQTGPRAHSGAGGVGELLRSEAGEGLDVLDV